MHKTIIVVALSFLISGCGTLGWVASHALSPKPRASVHIAAKIGRHVTQKTIPTSSHHLISTIPWPLIWLLMLGWPLALISWMLEPPFQFFQSSRRPIPKR